MDMKKLYYVTITTSEKIYKKLIASNNEKEAENDAVELIGRELIIDIEVKEFSMVTDNGYSICVLNK